MGEHCDGSGPSTRAEALGRDYTSGRNASTDMTCLGKDILLGWRFSPALGYDDGCQVTEARLLRQNRAHLFEMIHVVSGDLGGQVADRHLTALGVDAVSLPLFRGQPPEHAEIRSP